MKLTKRTRGHFILLLFLGILAGTMIWELLERFIALSGHPLDLTVGPLGFDAGVLEVWLSLNPGSPLGGIAGYLLFRRV
ncbi:MAG: hypothetical protein JW760_06590 [Spirochaetales bacterium]|nr:hypothetical protein [Spirochaetales bacterium]